MPFNDTPQGSTHHDKDACYKCEKCKQHFFLENQLQRHTCCEHKDVKIVGAIINTHLCFECGNNLVSNEIEILNQYYEIGGFCGNEKCKRYLILVV